MRCTLVCGAVVAMVSSAASADFVITLNNFAANGFQFSQAVAPGAHAMRLAALAAVLCGVLDLKAAGIASSLLLVVLGFAHGNRLLLALGLLSLAACVSWFYYALALNLLEKSLWLAVAGGALLLARVLLRVLLGPPPPAVDAHA